MKTWGSHFAYSICFKVIIQLPFSEKIMILVHLLSCLPFLHFKWRSCKGLYVIFSGNNEFTSVITNCQGNLNNITLKNHNFSWFFPQFILHLLVKMAKVVKYDWCVSNSEWVDKRIWRQTPRKTQPQLNRHLKDHSL